MGESALVTLAILFLTYPLSQIMSWGKMCCLVPRNIGGDLEMIVPWSP